MSGEGIDRHRHLKAVPHRIESFRVDPPDLLRLPTPRDLQDEPAVTKAKSPIDGVRFAYHIG